VRQGVSYDQAMRDTAAHPFDWHVHVNGSDIMGLRMVESCYASEIINSFEVSPHNEGQHPPSNRAIAKAIKDYDYLLRIDDDVEWLTKRWLAKLIESSQKLDDAMVLSPVVRGLRWQPTQSQLVEVGGVPLKFVEGPLGGICRLTPVALLEYKPYVSDVRFPMGGGDATGIGEWAMKTEPITPLAYCQHIRVRHAKTTDGQMTDDPKHFEDHTLFQHMPYIPIWTP
jgi:hypothetical protein